MDDIVAAQNALAEAIRQNDPDKRAAAVRPLMHSEFWIVQVSVLSALGDSGPKSLPALRAILKDEELRKFHNDAIRALGKAGGAEVGPELTELLKQEHAFWKKTAPGLPNAWWNGDGLNWEEVERLRNHYCVAQAAIIALGEIRHSGGREAVIEFRDYWKSLPQLDFDQMQNACETALKKMRHP
ncbi:MAG TPA: HEAT repeat domain-containing protein [Urbifossiella sp.]